MLSELREIQDKLANKGWRIEQILHAPSGKPVIIGFENWAGLLAVIAMMGFLIGLGMTIYLTKQGKSPDLGLYIATASGTVCALPLSIKNKLKKKDWVIVEAICIDREVLKAITPKGGLTWASRILCEINHEGTTIQCTPTVHWSSWRTESDANEFLNSKIDGNGRCRLKVNPKNPLEANLVAR